MSKNIYIGNLPWKTTEEEIQELLQKFGEVHSVKIIKDRETGRPRGFGFAEMENADAAISELNGKDFGGRSLRVNQARERAV